MADKDYLKIAKTRVHRPSKLTTYPKVLVYGRNKKGKSRLGLTPGIDNVLVMDPEGGTDLMKELNPWVWPLTCWEDTQEVYGALRTGKLSPNHLQQGESSTPFGWVSVDGLTRINNMALNYVRRVQEEKDLDRHPGLIQQRDYGKAGELMKQLLTNFHTLKMGVYYTAQEKMITGTGGFDDDEDIEENPDAFYVPDLPNSVRGAVNSIVDVIGRIYTVRVPDPKRGEGATKMQRRLQLGLHEKYDTGFRSDFVLPDMIKNPTLPKLVALMIQGGSE